MGTPIQTPKQNGPPAMQDFLKNKEYQPGTRIPIPAKGQIAEAPGIQTPSDINVLEAAYQTPATIAKLGSKFIKGLTFGGWEPPAPTATQFLAERKAKGRYVPDVTAMGKLAEIGGQAYSLGKIYNMIRLPVEGGIQMYGFLKGASPALKGAIRGLIAGGIGGAAESAAQQKSLGQGIIDTGTQMLLFGLLDAGATKFIDWLARGGVPEKESVQFVKDLKKAQAAETKARLAETRLGTVASKFPEHLQREARITGIPFQDTKGIKRYAKQREYERIFKDIPTVKKQIAQEQTSELLQKAHETIIPKQKPSEYRQWTDFLKDLNKALGKAGAIGKQ